jgi:ATP-binding cassette, subfamily B, bacterial
LKHYIQILGKHWFQYLLSAVIFMFVMFFRTVEPKIVQIDIDRVIGYYSKSREAHLSNHIQKHDAFTDFLCGLLPNFNTSTIVEVLLVLASLFVFFGFMRSFLLYLGGMLNAKATEDVMKDLRDWLFRHIQNLPMSFLSGTSKGELIQRSTGDVETLRYFLQEHFGELIRIIASFVFTILMMGTINWTYALINLIMVPFAIYFGWLYYRNSSKVWHYHEYEADKLNVIIQENLSNMRLIQSFSRQGYEKERFKAQNNLTKNEGIRMSLINSTFGFLIESIIYSQLFITLFAGFYFVMRGTVSIGELSAMYWLFLQLSWPMRQINRVLAQFGMAKVAVGRIFEILDASSEHKNEASSKLTLKGKIEFRDVSFRYKNKQQWVLKNVSFTIYPGEKVALTGPTGSGKSTLIYLLLRFYEPDEGVILFDDIDIRRIPLMNIRHQIGVAFQRPFLFSFSLKENISYGYPEATDEDISQISRIAEVDDILDSTLNGINSIAGERGSSLSGGQRQRIALARTLIANPKILVLDDITSALDTATEQRLFTQLNKHISEQTVILIAHRPVSIKRATKILILNQGTLTVSESNPGQAIENDYFKNILHPLAEVSKTSGDYSI